ncbi:MAG TPA: rhodanese-like domain-containing protein [Verrucomicrobiae bacterium]
MNQITPRELAEIRTAQPAVTVLDVRTVVEFAEVHATGARNVPLDELNPAALGLAPTEPVYLLCRSGQRAAKAADKLARAGFQSPVVVTGGTLAWVAAGLPVTRGETKVISLERQVRIAAGFLVLTGVLLGWFVHRAFFGLAGFVGAGLIFAGITDFCGMGLLLARMPWNKRA